MPLLVAVLVSLLAWLQYSLWLGENGILEYQALQVRLQEQTQENAQLAQRNQRLAAEVGDLKQGLDAIEERARSELGMVKKDEIFLLLATPEPKEPRNPLLH
ncbi:cell division protein FtsB [Allopseudospirillum japonicum]|uniref:Cell division protein FtsB n=1 Tax=Allopseudospirillum japonicum TaxID=64971 RepID=A0A1H6R8A2_9GAMM|nr:cell division protein FtsB [Allopseudospirillum japonicum]SEI48010.1 cell division protein FtsB [Allopseudospirillum japonicum]